MKYSKKTGVLLCLCLIMSSCGYKVAGFDTDTKFYLREVVNKSSYMGMSWGVSDYVTRFFSDYGLLEERDKAGYELSVALDRLDVSSVSRSASREATSSQVNMRYTFTVQDKEKRIVYSKSMDRAVSFSTGSDTAGYTSQLEENIYSLTEDMLSEFKYDFDISKK